jgi:maleamate amidohydrolase
VLDTIAYATIPQYGLTRVRFRSSVPRVLLLGRHAGTRRFRLTGEQGMGAHHRPRPGLEPTSSGIGGSVGFGEAPALLVIDAQNGFTNPDSPLGAVADTALETISLLTAEARRAGLPVFYTISVWHPEANNWARKVPAQRSLLRGTALTTLDDRLTAKPEDTVVEKHFASGFFGTHLAEKLIALGIDTLIVTGLTTSGCVRASVVDACSHGFRVIVPREAVADRDPQSHDMSLADMESRYADVMPYVDVSAYLAQHWADHH